MAIIGSEVMKLMFVTNLQGERAVTRLNYWTEDDDLVPAINFLTAWQTACQAPLLALMTSVARLDRIAVQRVGSLPDDEATVFPALQGTAGVGVTNTLPPHVALGFRKLPNNALLEGTNPTPMSPGSFRLMGQSETWQDAGLWNATLTPLALALAIAVHTITVPMGVGDDRVYQMYMDRPPLTPNGPPQTAVPVDYLVRATYVTSQNTRKLR